jgi:SAM-dependent methyltransferase
VPITESWGDRELGEANNRRANRISDNWQYMDNFQINRKQVFSPFVHRELRGIEIGAGYRPTFPKAEGYSVTVIDCCGTDELIAKHKANLLIPEELIGQIEAVDVVWSGDSLQRLPVVLRGFDYIVACHVIEHATDLCGFLSDCSALLKEGGFLLLAIPDRRCVMDFYRPASTLGDVLLAHLLPHAYDLKSQLDEVWYGAVLNFVAWSFADLRRATQCGQAPSPAYPVDAAGSVWNRCTARGVDHAPDQTYRDAHRWVFDPASFAQIADFLAVNAGTNLTLEAMPAAFECEFYAVLRKSLTSDAIANRTLENHRAGVLRARLANIEAEISTQLPPLGSGAPAG